MWLKGQDIKEGPGRIVLSVAMPAADPEVTCLILTWSHTLVEIGHDINFCFHSPPADSRRVVVSYKTNYVHEVLVNPLVKLAQVKKWFGELTVST